MIRPDRNSCMATTEYVSPGNADTKFSINATSVIAGRS
jgi:hypothetical protein